MYSSDGGWDEPQSWSDETDTIGAGEKRSSRRNAECIRRQELQAVSWSDATIERRVSANSGGSKGAVEACRKQLCIKYWKKLSACRAHADL